MEQRLSWNIWQLCVSFSHYWLYIIPLLSHSEGNERCGVVRHLGFSHSLGKKCCIKSVIFPAWNDLELEQSPRTAIIPYLFNVKVRFHHFEYDLHSRVCVCVFSFLMFKSLISNKFHKKTVPYLSKGYLLKNTIQSRRVSLAEEQLVLFAHVTYLDFWKQMGECPLPRKNNKMRWQSYL